MADEIEQIMENVAQPELVWVHSQVSGDHVHVGLDGKGYLGFGRRPHVAAGYVVGIHHIAVDIDVGDNVWAAATISAAQVDPGLISAVGPAVENGGSLPGHQRAIVFDAGFQGDTRGHPPVHLPLEIAVPFPHFQSKYPSPSASKR